MEVRHLYTLLASFITMFLDKNSADLVFSECDRSKTGSDKFYEFKYNDLKGEENYEELNALLDEFGGEDACSLKVIAFPSGQFHNQEPDKPEELLEVLKFVRPGKGFTPKMDFSTKVDVNGQDESPIFSFLKDVCPRPSPVISGDGDTSWKPLKVSDIRWNFEKFLIDHKGIPVRRYLHFTMPMEMKDEVENAIKNCTESNKSDEEKQKAEEKKEAADLEKEEKNKSYSKENSKQDDSSANQTNEPKKTEDSEKTGEPKRNEEPTKNDQPTKNDSSTTSPLTQTPKMEQGQLQNQNQNPIQKRYEIPRHVLQKHFLRMLHK